MAEIHLGFQYSLNRPIALKKPHSDKKDPSRVLSLLQEALITSVLEHPGIVPVYDLTLNEEQEPMLVMKYIQGRSWTEILKERPLRRSGQWEVWIEEQLRIFGQVCNAVHFAHSRGILHRDLKPENVMVGDFGDVYLLDWGVAVSLYEDEDSLFPLAREQDCIAGTPAYMSPEQTQPEKVALSEKTDIYLLGAILFEVLTGLPPHQSNSLKESLRSAYLNTEWTLPEDLPPFLVKICTQAMHSRPSQRYSSAEVLHQQVQSYFRFRDSMRLTESTDRELLELEVLLEQVDDWEELPEEMRVNVERSFARCQYGYAQAQELWPINKEARVGLQNTLELRVQLALANNSTRQAELFLAQLPTPNPKLQESLQRQRDSRRRQTREIQTFREMQEQHSPRIGMEFRFQLLTYSTLFWLVLTWSNVLFGWVSQRHFSMWEMLGLQVLWLAVLLWMHYRSRITIKATPLNLLFMRLVYFAVFLLSLSKVMGWVLKRDVYFVLQLDILLLAVLLTLIAILLDPPTFVPALILWAGVGIGFLWKKQMPLVVAISCIFLLGTIFSIQRALQIRISNDSLFSEQSSTRR